MLAAFCEAITGTCEEDGGEGVLRRPRRSKIINPTIRTKPTTPPTTPPAIAPTFVFLDVLEPFVVELAVLRDEVLDGVGSLVDSGPLAAWARVTLKPLPVSTSR
jgi:hypothetical protein